MSGSHQSIARIPICIDERVLQSQSQNESAIRRAARGVEVKRRGCDAVIVSLLHCICVDIVHALDQFVEQVPVESYVCFERQYLQES